MKKQVRAYYSGRVQGIGFRFTAARLAEGLGIAGRVSNLGDGRVELVAEASEEALKDFLSQINNTFSRYIQDTDVSWETATGEFKGFAVN